MERRQRITFALIAAAIAVVAAVLLAGGGEEEPERIAATATPEATAEPGGAGEPTATPAAEPTPAPAPAVPEIVVSAGRVRGGVAELRVRRGERVRFSVRSDAADHVHVHGYDIFKDVPAGEPVRVAFEAGIVGVFEVELEDSGTEIARLRVDQ